MSPWKNYFIQAIFGLKCDQMGIPLLHLIIWKTIQPCLGVADVLCRECALDDNLVRAPVPDGAGEVVIAHLHTRDVLSIPDKHPRQEAGPG